MYPLIEESNIAIIGLGYVGLPLAIEFATATNKISNSRKIIGYDISEERISELKNNFDRTKEIDFESIDNLNNLLFTSNKEDLIEAQIFIISVPTPITEIRFTI